MPTFGVHAFVWSGAWNNEIAPETIRLTSEAGFDLLEIPMLPLEEFDSQRIKKLLSDHHLRAVTSLALPKDTHLPFYPDKALTLLKGAVDKTEAVGSDVLTGCLYTHLGTMTGRPPTQAELDTEVNVLGEVALYAKQRGIRIGIEPVNRYESYLYNTGTAAVDLINAIGTGNLFLHYDTYHMNIEEQGFGSAIQRTGSLCSYVHMSESDRGMLGRGNVDWDDVFMGLKAVNFTGTLTLEAFAGTNPDLVAVTWQWRPSGFTGRELAAQGLEFLRLRAEKAGLA